MDPPLSVHTSAFQRALENFQAGLSQADQDDFKYTTLGDLQGCILQIQREHASARKAKNMNRLSSFLEAMEQYGNVIEVFLNTSQFIAFIWGPTKFLLQVASSYSEAFDDLLDVYKEIGENFPMLAQYESLFTKEYMGKLLENLYVDILEFHHKAYKYFKLSVWKQIYRASWKTFRTRFKPLLENLRRHKSLVETQASLFQFEEIQRQRVTAEAEFSALREAEDLRRYRDVQDWLSAANMEAVQEDKSNARTGYPGVCRWILTQAHFQSWMDHNIHTSSFLWIHGIPGAGKTTLASFLIEHLRSIPDTQVLYFYCKHEDTDRNSFVSLARAMTGQVLGYNRVLLPHLYEQAVSCGERPLRTLRRSQEVLSIALQSLHKPYIVIDGLDECPPKEKQGIARWFQSLIKSEHDNGATTMKCMMISQNDKETRLLFKDWISVEVGKSSTGNDINRFCQIEGEKIREKFPLSEPEKNTIVEMVCNQAEDMFLFAKLVMTNLLNQTRLVNLKRELQPGRFPQGIDQAYARIIDRILDPNSPERDDVKQVLGLLVCARRTLKWSEIQGAVSLDAETGTFDFHSRRLLVDAKDLCGSLVEITSGGAVELVHITAKQYLLHRQFLIQEEEELRMSRLCLIYLSMPCFDQVTTEEELSGYIRSGHYCFTEYAMCFWPEHLIHASAIPSSGDMEPTSSVVARFLDAHASTGSSTLPIPQEVETDLNKFREYDFFNKLCQAVASLDRCKRNGSEGTDSVSSLDLERTLIRIRSVFENLCRSDELKTELKIIYGANLYKCSELQCKSFFEGFADLEQCQQHKSKHVRPFHCYFEGCIAAKSGFASFRDLRTHLRQVHDSASSHEYPTKQNPILRDALRAAKDANLPLLDRYLRSRLESRWDLQSLWLTAIKNPNDAVFDLLRKYAPDLDRHHNLDWHNIRHILKETPNDAKCDILQRLTTSDSFRPGYFNTTAFAKMRADAIRADDENYLTFLNDEILRKLDLKALRKNNKRSIVLTMTELCVKACSAGSLKCAKYLAPLCEAESRSITGSQSGPVNESSWAVDALDAAVERGHLRIVEFLFRYDDNLPSLDSTAFNKLYASAANNGHEGILEFLRNKDDPSREKDDFFLFAQLYNAIRRGDGPTAYKILLSVKATDLGGNSDRYGCSLLHYAALNGLLHVVDDLILRQNADVNHMGFCPDITCRSSQSHTSLVLATFKGHTPVVKRLLQCPKINNDGYINLRARQSGIPAGHSGRPFDALRLAKMNDHQSIVSLLEEHTAMKQSSSGEDVGDPLLDLCEEGSVPLPSPSGDDLFADLDFETFVNYGDT